MRPLNRVILHCSATMDAADLVGAEEIRRYHVGHLGWDDIGYHIVIRRSGQIETGRPIEQPGAHSRGQNADSIGVCWVGTRWPTFSQIKSLQVVYRNLRRQHGIHWDQWWGHREMPNVNKDCPGVPMDLVREMFRGMTE